MPLLHWDSEKLETNNKYICQQGKNKIKTMSTTECYAVIKNEFDLYILTTKKY